MTEILPSRPTPTTNLSPAARDALETSPARVIEQWLARVQPGTRRKYQQALRDFGVFIFDRESPPEDVFRFITEQEPGPGHVLVERWRDQLLASGLAPGSVNGLLTGLGSLVSLARRLGLCSWKLERVALPPEKRQDRSGPAREHVAQLVGYLDRLANAGDVLAIRDVAIVRLLYGVALRRAEVTGLDLNHVQLDHGDGSSVLVRRKGRRERTRMFVGPRCSASLAAWIDERGGAAGPLFARLDRARGRQEGQRLSGESVRRMLAKRALSAGVQAPCRPHGLRHSSATQIAATGSVARLKAFGGWASLSAIQHYLDREDEEQRAATSSVEL